MKTEVIDSKIEYLVQQWLCWLRCEKHVSENTVDAYRRDVVSCLTFVKYYGDDSSDLSSIDVLTLRAWLTERHERQNMALSSSARAMSAVRNFFKYLSCYHGINNQYIRRIKNPKISKNLPKPLEFEDIAILLDACQDELLWVKLRNIALFSLLYGCGLRISEALGLRMRDIIGNNLRVLGKGNKDRMVPVLQVVIEKLLEYINVCPYFSKYNSNDYIFYGKKGDKMNRTYCAKIIRSMRNKLNLPSHTTLHSMRHSFASHLLNNGADMRSVQELLGHERLSTTQIYAKIENRTMFEVYRNTHPLALKDTLNDD